MQKEVSVGLAIEPPDAPTQLIKLCEAKPIGAFNDQSIAVGDIEAGLDDGRADEDVVLPRDEGGHGFFQFACTHLPVANNDARFGYQGGQPFGNGPDGLHAIVQVEDLAAAGQLGLHGIAHEFLVVAADDGADGEAFAWGRLNDAQVAGAHEGEVERPWNRGRTHGKHIDLGAHLLQAFLVTDAEAVLFIDDDEAEFTEGGAVGEQGVGADYDVNRARGGAGTNVSFLLGGAEAAQQFDGDGPARQAFPEAFIVLLREHRRGCEDRDLPSAEDALERGAQGHLGLAEAHVAADETIHRGGPFHVALDVCDGTRLVGGLAVGEGAFELAHPGIIGVFRVGDARLSGTGRLHGEQLRREVRGGFLGGFPRAFPAAASELRKFGRGAADTDVTRE